RRAQRAELGRGCNRKKPALEARAGESKARGPAGKVLFETLMRYGARQRLDRGKLQHRQQQRARSVVDEGIVRAGGHHLVDIDSGQSRQRRPGWTGIPGYPGPNGVLTRSMTGAGDLIDKVCHGPPSALPSSLNP